MVSNNYVPGGRKSSTTVAATSKERETTEHSDSLMTLLFTTDAFAAEYALFLAAML